MHRATLICIVMLLSCPLAAHPLVENALDLVIAPGKVFIEARIASEEIAVESKIPVNSIGDREIAAHGAYLLKHFRLEIDGQMIDGDEVQTPSKSGPLWVYHLEYPTPHPPARLRFYQTLLIDRDPWTALCTIRMRQSTDEAFQTKLLSREETAEFTCEWPSTTQPTASIAPKPPGTGLFRAYLGHGIMHILTGYDHLLFVSALVLATTSLWDLVKVVAAFTLAHTLTLTLSVFHIVRLSEHLVEPMISASIVCVALQNVLWPRTSRGWWRLGIAFAFGLFHGLGFAGGLMDAMGELSHRSLWIALIAFSLGVEIGHQIVVLPLFGLLRMVRWHRGDARVVLYRKTVRIGSGMIAVAGMYYFYEAIR